MMNLSCRALVALAAVGLTIGLAACSDDSDDSSDNSASGSDTDSSLVETEGTFPQTVSTKFGDVTIDEQPTRVIALGWGDAETALELGVQPVGASDWLDFGGEGVGPWMEGAYENSPKIIGTLEPEYEEIAALDPDLILDVRSSGEQERYDKLSEIATTVGVPEGSDSYLTPREQQVEMISTALGLPETGEEISAEYQETVDRIGEDHPEWRDLTISTVALTSNGWGAYIPGSERLDTLLDLGFQPSEDLSADDVGDSGFSIQLSDETLGRADSDVVIAFPIGKTAEDVDGNSAWQRLSATEDGRSFVMPEEISSAYSLGSPAAIQFALEELVPTLEEHTS